MTTRETFRAVMAERRLYRNNPRYRIEWGYLTRAARQLVWIIRGIPVSQWGDVE